MNKTANYSPAQVAIIAAVAASNGGVLNYDLAKVIAARDDMRTAEGETREPKSIVAKISRMVTAKEVTADGVAITYARKVAETKDGKPITKKADLVTRIAAAVGVDRSTLESMDKSSKGALELLADKVEALRDEADAANDEGTGTEG